jgi:hypothetical protein
MAKARAERAARWKSFAVLFRTSLASTPRSARQAGERTGRLSGTVTSHAAVASAIDLECCRRRKPGHRRVDVAEGGTAHGSFVRIEGFV